MSKKVKSVFNILGILLGLALIAVAIFGAVRLGSSRREAALKNQEMVEVFYNTVTDIYDGLMYDRSDVQMPVIQLEGSDVIGILEVPLLSVKLPVSATWDKIETNYIPSRLSGSIYDRSLIIGGTDAEGQLDFCSDICIGDTVVFTDASGARYEYTLERVNMMGSLDAQKEYSSGDDLTVFAKDSYFNEYTVLHLKLK